MKKVLLLLLLAFYAQSCSQSLDRQSAKQVLGWVEKARVSSQDFHAKLDPGSELSSINAEDIKPYKKSGKSYVKFKLVDRNGKSIIYKKKVVRKAKIKQSSGKKYKRIIVKFPICLGNTLMEEEVALADRNHLDYEMLIGRSFLAGNVIVDPSKTFTIEPSCQ